MGYACIYMDLEISVDRIKKHIISFFKLGFFHDCDSNMKDMLL